MYISTLALTSALSGGGWSTPRPGHFTPSNDSVPTVQEAGWAARRVLMGAVNLAPHWHSIRGPSSPQRVAIPTELYRLTIYICYYRFYCQANSLELIRSADILFTFYRGPGQLSRCSDWLRGGPSGDRIPVGSIYDTIYLTAIEQPPGGSSTVHIYTQTIQRTTHNQQYI